MAIRVQYQPDFNLVGQLAYDTGLGQSSQRGLDAMMRSREAAANRQHQMNMFELQNQARIDAAQTAFERAKAQDQWRYDADMRRLGQQSSFLQERQRLEDERQMAYMKEKQIEDQYTSVMNNLNKGTVSLDPQVQVEVDAQRKKIQKMKDAVPTTQAQGRAALTNMIIQEEKKLRGMVINGAKEIPKHQRPWTMEERMSWIKEMTPLLKTPEYEGWEVGFGRDGQPTFSYSSKTEVEKDRVDLEYKKAQLEAMQKPSMGSEKQTTEIKRKSFDLQRELKEFEKADKAHMEVVEKLDTALDLRRKLKEKAKSDNPWNPFDGLSGKEQEALDVLEKQITELQREAIELGNIADQQEEELQDAYKARYGVREQEVTNEQIVPPGVREGFNQATKTTYEDILKEFPI